MLPGARRAVGRYKNGKNMRITQLKSFHADGGWRPYSFLKISTDESLIGWSEYVYGPWAPALPQIIDALGDRIIGRDPRQFRVIRADLNAQTKFAPGGLASQAIAAIENACIDLAAKAANLSVSDLFGGALRESIDLYWSHCGSFRAQHADVFRNIIGVDPIVDLDGLKRLGEEVASKGFRAAKTNPILFRKDGAKMRNPGFGPDAVGLSGGIDTRTIVEIESQIAALREGAGNDVDLMLDVNFAYSPSAVAELEAALRDYRLKWIEYDAHNPQALGRLRQSMQTPLASLETIYQCNQYKSYLDATAADISIIDVLWNGFSESVRIAELSESYGVNVAPHNFYGPMSDLITANFCAIAPNLEIMEIEAEDVPWKYQLLTEPPIRNGGAMEVPKGVGWGADIDESAVAHHPWKGKS